MPVYVDNMRAPFRGMKLGRMVADSISELLDMADKIGMKREWYLTGSHPHFDVNLTRLAYAVSHGAIEVDRRELVAAMRRHRAKWKAEPAELEAINLAASAVIST